MSTFTLVVTGTSTGLGRAITELVLEKGEVVVATARRPETLDDLAQKYPAERLLTLRLDVTQPQQVADAFNKTKERFGRIDVVVNNAGIANAGELEGIEEAEARSLFETNFWGAVDVTKEAVRFFRETNPPGVGGRLLQMSSYLGLVGMPGCAFYSAAKFGEFAHYIQVAGQAINRRSPIPIALEGTTEALAGELDPEWNIKVRPAE